jgi:hypothetical protein
MPDDKVGSPKLGWLRTGKDVHPDLPLEQRRPKPLAPSGKGLSHRRAVRQDLADKDSHPPVLVPLEPTVFLMTQDQAGDFPESARTFSRVCRARTWWKRAST